MPPFLFILEVLANLINTRKEILKMRRQNVHQISNVFHSKTCAVAPTEDMLSLKLPLEFWTQAQKKR